MSVLDRYPDTSDPSPNFMYGRLDLTEPGAESPQPLGEALLALHLPEHPPLGAPHVYRPADPQTEEGRRFLSNILAAEPAPSAADDGFLNLLVPRTG
jgi:hypothetical protein